MSREDRELEDFDAINAEAIDRDACPLCWCLDTGGALCADCREATS